MKLVMGTIRVSEEEEIMGLDISEHGSYGYPEQMSTETVVAVSVKETTSKSLI